MTEVTENESHSSRAGVAAEQHRRGRSRYWLAAILVIALIGFVAVRGKQTQMPAGQDSTQAGNTMPGESEQSLGAGYAGADSLLINGDFELSSDREAIDSWTLEGEAVKVPTRSNTYFRYGSYSLRLLDENGGSQAEVYQDVNFSGDLVGKRFTFYSWIRLADGAENRKVTIRVIDGTRDYVYQPVVTEKWELYSFSGTILPAKSEDDDTASDRKVDNVRVVLNVSPPGDMRDRGEAFFDGAKLSIIDGSR